MIQRKTKDGLTTTNSVIIDKPDGTSVEVTEVLKYNAAADTTEDVFPGPATVISARTTYDSEFKYPHTDEPDSRWKMPQFNVEQLSYIADPLVLEVEVYPTNAKWYCEAQIRTKSVVTDPVTGDNTVTYETNPHTIVGLTVEEDGVTPKIWSGSVDLESPFPQLDTVGVVDIRVDFYAYKGNIPNPVHIWVQQERSIVSTTLYSTTFEFENSLTSNEGSETFTNVYDKVTGSTTDPVFVSATDGEFGLAGNYSQEIVNFNEDPINGLGMTEDSDRFSHNMWEADFSNVLPANWHREGFTMNMVMGLGSISGNSARFGFIERERFDWATDPYGATPPTTAYGTTYAEVEAAYPDEIYSLGDLDLGNNICISLGNREPGLLVFGNTVAGIGANAIGGYDLARKYLTDEKNDIMVSVEVVEYPFEDERFTFDWIDGSHLYAYYEFSADMGTIDIADRTLSVNKDNYMNKNFGKENFGAFITRAYYNGYPCQERCHIFLKESNMEAIPSTQGTNYLGNPITVYHPTKLGRYHVENPNGICYNNPTHPLAETVDTYIPKTDWRPVINQTGAQKESAHTDVERSGDGRVAINYPANDGTFTIWQNNSSKTIDTPITMYDLKFKTGPSSVSDAIVATLDAGCSLLSSKLAGSSIPDAPSGSRRAKTTGTWELPDTYPLEDVLIKPMVVDERLLCVGGGFEDFYTNIIKKVFSYSWVSDFNNYWDLEHGYMYNFTHKFNLYDAKEWYEARIVQAWDDASNFYVVDTTDPNNPINIPFEMVGRMTHSNSGKFTYSGAMNDPDTDASDYFLENLRYSDSSALPTKPSQFDYAGGKTDPDYIAAIDTWWEEVRTIVKAEDWPWASKLDDGLGFVTNQFAYLQLDTPIQEGHTYEIGFKDYVVTGYDVDGVPTGTALGATHTGELVYDHNTPSRAIKINQEGYVNDSTTDKTVYVGSWLGAKANLLVEPDSADYALGTSDAAYIADYAEWRESARLEYDRVYKPHESCPEFTGAFQVYSVDDMSTPVFTAPAGSMSLRSDAGVKDYYFSNWSTANTPEEGYVRGVDPDATSYYTNDGEDPWEGDFASINVPDGKYKIHVDGIGWSWEFALGNEAFYRPLYMIAKGLYSQRCSFENGMPYTKWKTPAKLDRVWEGTAANSGSPGDGPSGEFTTLAGAPVSVNIFTNREFTLDQSPTGRVLRHAQGGYHDAADFDRRPIHVDSVKHLGIAFLMNPTVWKDGQFNIPESGNGIPDILSEMEHGLKHVRADQRADGSCAIWAEAVRHEDSIPGYLSKLKYVTGDSSAFESLTYAAAAAILARGLALVDTPLARAKSAVWLESAQRAYEYGANNLSVSYFNLDGAPVMFTETADKRDQTYMYIASAELYGATRDKRYLENCTDEYFETWINKHLTSFGDYMLYNPCYALAFDMDKERPEHAHKWKRANYNWADAWIEVGERWNYRKYLFAADNQPMRWTDDTLEMGSYGIPGSYTGFTNYNGFGKEHAWGRAGIHMLYALKLAEKEGTAEDVQKYKNALMHGCNYTNGASPTGRSAITGVGKVWPTSHLEYHSPRYKALDIYEPRWGMIPYGGIDLNGCFSNWGGMHTNLWTLRTSDRSDFDYTGIELNLMPGGYIEKWGLSASSGVGGYLKTWFPRWRVNQYLMAGSAVTQGEYTVEECQIPALAMMSGLLDSNGDTSWQPSGELVNFDNLANSPYFKPDGSYYESALHTP